MPCKVIAHVRGQTSEGVRKSHVKSAEVRRRKEDAALGATPATSSKHRLFNVRERTPGTSTGLGIVPEDCDSNGNSRPMYEALRDVDSSHIRLNLRDNCRSSCLGLVVCLPEFPL